MGRNRKTETIAQESERRRQARDRRENVRKRQREAALRELPEVPAPVMTIRMFPKVLKTGNSNIVMAFLTENRPAKHIEGRYKMAPLVKHLNIALGVYTLLTYRALVVLLGTGARAKDKLRTLRGGPGDIDYRLSVGRDHLASRTAFDSEDEVERWTNNKYVQLNAGAAPDGTVLRPQFVETEMQAVTLVFRAYERAQLVLTALNDAVDMNDDEAAARLDAADSHSSTQLTRSEVLQVAMLADINPAELWRQYGAVYGPTFEFGRFVGRVNAGVEAMLNPEQFAFAKQVLDAKREDAGLSRLWIALRELVRRHFSIEKFCLAIHMAEAVNGVIRVSRSTRELSVERPGIRHVITDP
jgi:hypothetical protein